MRKTHALYSCTSALTLMFAALPVHAQVQSDDSVTVDNQSTVNEAADSEDNGQIIVVTGSRIQSGTVETIVPVVTFAADSIYETGKVALGDILNELPSLRTTFGQANSTRFIGTAGVNFLDLRGLGTQSTLVLQNGRRHVSASPGLFRVDVNTIPTDLVERVDIVTGGTSAVYGSDAVAGVVNFVLKDNFEGVQARGRTGISSRGDRATYSAALTVGMNFADDRGNIAISNEYNRSNELNYLDRPNQSGAFSGRTQLQFNEDPAGETNGSDGIPDRILRRNVRSLGSSFGGTFIASGRSGSTAANVNGGCANAVGCIGTPGTPTGNNGVPRIYRFQPDGSLVEADYGEEIRIQTGRSTGNQIGGDGNTARQYGQFAPFVERFGTNAIGHFEISEAFVPYFEAKYIRYNIFQQASPTFASGGTQFGSAAAQTSYTTNSTGIPIRLDNPYLTAQAASLIRATTTSTQTAFRLQRTNIDMGSREETGSRETYRGVFGIKGDFNDDWHYDVSANYGNFRQDLLSNNNRIQQRFRLSVDAARNSAGQIVCRSQLPGVVTPIPTLAADAAALAADIAACVPVNILGEGNITQAALDYFNADTLSVQKHEQFVVSGYLTGDSSQWLELPGGPVGFAIGGEYRQENGFRSFGELVSSGRTFLTAIADFQPPEKFEVKEAFAELNAPLLRDRPFFHELSVQGAVRVADYKGAVGTVLAWNAGGTWAPVEDIRFRGNYAVSVRAPTQFDLFAQPGQNFGSIGDPCDVVNRSNGTSTRDANCTAAGIAAGFVNAPARASSTAFSIGGNPLLTEERSKSITAGVVLTPRFVPGLTITADYYDIEISDVIGAPSAQQIVNACYDAASIDNPFCPFVFRDPATNFFVNTPPTYGIQQIPINYSAGKARGVDFEVAYQRQLEGIGRLNARAVGTYVLQRDDFPFVSEPDRPDQNLLELGDPRLQVNGSFNLKTDGGVTFGYQVRYISKQAVTAIEDLRTVGERPPQNADFADFEFYKAAWYHDFRIGMDVNEQFNLYAGIDNAFDRLPEADLLGNGGGDGIYDNIGRYFYIGAKAKF